MAIGLNEEHVALRESVTGWADRNIPSETMRETVKTAAITTRPAFWTGLADQGLLGLHVPEEYGGAGYGLLETAVVIEALAERMAPGPYVPTVLASAVLLASQGGKAAAELVPGLADGTRTGAVALAAGLTGETAADGGLIVGGTVEPVLGGALADVLILPMATGEGERWVAVQAQSLNITPLPSLDLTRGVARVTAEALAVPAEHVIDGTRARGLAAVLLGAEAAGLAGWCVRAAAEYAKVREQFGRPIGQFQAIKHKVARMLVQLEQARATVWDATRATGPEWELAAAVAAVVAPDAAVACAKDAIQTFGGIGYTFEHDVHLYYRRALTLRGLLGVSAEWSDKIAGLMLSGVRRELRLDLPPEAEPIRERVRAEIAEIAALPEAERGRALAAAGLSMPHLQAPWGRGASPLEQVLIHRELRAAGVKPPELIIGAWVVPSVAVYGTAEQQERFLLKTLSGEVVWCQLFSEPGAGSDLAGVQMRAERVEGGWRLNGQKIWTSLAQVAEWGICIARTNPDKPKHKGITYFLVDMKAPGLSVRPLVEMTGEEMFNEVFFDDVFVPDDMVVGEVDDGWRVARNTLSNERVSMSGSAGASGAALTDLLRLVERLGRDLTPAERAAFAAVAAEAHSINTLSLRATLRQLAGTEPGGDASVGKLLSTSHAQHIAECAVDLLGPNVALAADPRLGDAGYWNRAALATRAMTIYGGTTEVQLNIIAERMLGLPRDA
ncbi:acyl-CoA dehydrogenase [Sinosporangium siamense]|uniref:Acyl-CoA dehydrogenase FadE n=1 Tax=Sinosporangium siamense TaxID=1367973 RepID=A0A919RBZ2_9ACTN|nr:acyl-CoA dehydrogenase [Sinosporangium siamense]GII91093.1 putative acyl-CoA dehydrogenase FadE [Sinosporangium siamense]